MCLAAKRGGKGAERRWKEETCVREERSSAYLYEFHSRAGRRRDSHLE